MPGPSRRVATSLDSGAGAATGLGIGDGKYRGSLLLKDVVMSGDVTVGSVTLGALSKTAYTPPPATVIAATTVTARDHLLGGGWYWVLIVFEQSLGSRRLRRLRL